MSQRAGNGGYTHSSPTGEGEALRRHTFKAGALATSRRFFKAGLLATAISLVGMFGATIDRGVAAPGVNGKIVYQGFDPDMGGSDIYTVNADGTGTTRLTFDGSAKGNPEWSPDGSKISFDGSAVTSGGSCCSWNIYVMNADGSSRQRLTTTPSTDVGQDRQATWAPQGNWMAFVSTRDEAREFAGDREIYRMNADGTQQTQLTVTDARTSDEQPSIAPGGKIAFASNRVDPLGGGFDIFTMNSDGSNVNRITFDGTPDTPVYPSPESINPAWSPDGSRIAFESTRSGDREIWIANADGSGLVNVSNTPGYDAEPAWSPDGTQITFTSLRSGGNYDVWAVDAPAASANLATALPLVPTADIARAASPARNLTARFSGEAHSANWGIASSTACTITGSAGADVLSGTSGADVICGLGGNDKLSGLAGNDILRGGGGNDTLIPGGGGNTVSGGVGTDLVSYSGASQAVILSLSAGTATGPSGDALSAIENATGSKYADRIVGNAGANSLTGGSGSDDLRGVEGPDMLRGGDGDDSLSGGAGIDSCAGGAGTNSLVGCES